jgi:hypothetical protein
MRLAIKDAEMKTKHNFVFVESLAQNGSDLRLSRFIERPERRAHSSVRSCLLIAQASVLLCATSLTVGCASTGHRVSDASFDQSSAPGAETPAAPMVTGPVILDDSAFRNLDLNGDKAFTPEESQHFNTNAASFSILSDKVDGPLLQEAPKHSGRYQLLGGANAADDHGLSGDANFFSPQGWTLFSIHF